MSARAGDGFEARRLWQKAPCFMLVICEGSDSADAAGIVRAERFPQLEGVGHQREEHSEVAEVAFWAESVVGAGGCGFDDERAREVAAGDDGVALVESNGKRLAALERRGRPVSPPDALCSEPF